ncbi:MAG: hypothetical protein V3V24_09610 [Nitrospinaceae bacterium]
MTDNPLVVSCPDDTWILVAPNTQSASIHKLSVEPGVYKQTYRISGQAAPTDDTDAIIIFETDTLHIFSHSPGVDIYIKAIGGDGSVRLDA